MRQIVLDTETTGLEVAQGHRVIEVAAVELLDRRLTGRHFHRYVNPQRSIDEGALRVHGLDEAFLADKPTFAQIADELCDFLRGGQLVIHNAPFDVGFLAAEFALLGVEVGGGVLDDVVDTLALARELHPGKRNSLDALCERYAVDNSGRQLHGALLDAELLAGVYLAMTRGQETLAISSLDEAVAAAEGGDDGLVGLDLPILRASDAERADHVAYLQGMNSAKVIALWQQLDEADDAA